MQYLAYKWSERCNFILKKVAVFCSESCRSSRRKLLFFAEEVGETRGGSWQVFETKPPKPRNSLFLFYLNRKDDGEGKSKTSYLWAKRR